LALAELGAGAALSLADSTIRVVSDDSNLSSENSSEVPVEDDSALLESVLEFRHTLSVNFSKVIFGETGAELVDFVVLVPFVLEVGVCLNKTMLSINLMPLVFLADLSLVKRVPVATVIAPELYLLRRRPKVEVREMVPLMLACILGKLNLFESLDSELENLESTREVHIKELSVGIHSMWPVWLLVMVVMLFVITVRVGWPGEIL